MRGVADGHLDAAITFCAGEPPQSVELLPLDEELAVVHLASDHALAQRDTLALADIRGRLNALAGEAGALSVREFSAMNRADYERSGRLIRETGIMKHHRKPPQAHRRQPDHRSELAP